MPSIGNIDPSVEDRERAALVLVPRVEALAASRQRLGNFDRPTRQWRAILQRHGKDTVARSGNICNHGVAIDRLRRLVDDRGAGDAERVDIAAIQARERDRTAQRTSPDLPTRACVDRLDIVVFGSYQKLSRRRSGRPPIERLGIEVARDLRMKARVEMDVAGAFPGQPRDDEVAAAVGAAMVGQHRLPVGAPGDRKSEQENTELGPPWRVRLGHDPAAFP